MEIRKSEAIIKIEDKIEELKTKFYGLPDDIRELNTDELELLASQLGVFSGSFSIYEEIW